MKTQTATRRARKSIRTGKRGQEWIAGRLQTVWPAVKSLWTAGRGSRQKDLADETTPFTFEVKKRSGASPWPAFLEKALIQASYYHRERADAASPVVILLNSPGAGFKQEWRVYMDGEAWLERELYIKQLDAKEDR